MNGEIFTIGSICQMELYDKSGSIVGITIFSKKHKEKVNKFRWYLHKDRKGKRYVQSGKGGKLHRLILNTPRELVVDHKNHDTLDNRDCNIKNCTQRENNLNMIKRKDNTSGIVGVFWNKENKRWRASIERHGKKYWLGSYKKKSDAKKARKEAEEKL